MVREQRGTSLAEFGLAALFFLAGLEIDFARVGGRVLRRSLLGWVLALAVATGVGMAVARNVNAGVYIGVALTSTALGTIMLVLPDTGDLRTPFGTPVTGIGAVGEFGPLVAISLFLSARRPGSSGRVGGHRVTARGCSVSPAIFCSVPAGPVPPNQPNSFWLPWPMNSPPKLTSSHLRRFSVTVDHESRCPRVAASPADWTGVTPGGEPNLDTATDAADL